VVAAAASWAAFFEKHDFCHPCSSTNGKVTAYNVALTFDYQGISMPSSLLALLDDIATLLDDVAVLTKVAVKKTAGVLGDDLALNAQQVAGVAADRELPVVWAVAKGSAINKVILVPAALAISFIAPWLIIPILMFGGAFLCFEGFEKIAHKLLHSKVESDKHHQELKHAIEHPDIDLVALESDKIKGAIRTDFILSAEIIVIALGSVATASFAKQATTIVLISVIMTIGVYGLVAGIVKLDDAGVWLLQRGSSAATLMGRGILWFAPKLMHTLSVVGTAAMFMVGGGILVHGWPWLYRQSIALTSNWGWIAGVADAVVNGIAGVIAGAICVALYSSGKKAWPKR
jgi:uncharacterized protein